MRFSWGDRWPEAAIIAAAAMMIVPLWLVGSPAMPDYPAHLASFYLIGGGAHEPHLAQFYRIEWAAIPNIASEAIVPVLGRAIGIACATKLFLSVALALWVVGPALIQRALSGRVGPAALAAALFAYNANFLWGFFNYDFAAGLAFVSFAGWIATARWSPTLRIPVFILAVLAIYFSHVFAVAVLMLLIGCYEATLWFEQTPRTLVGALRRLWPVAFIFLPAMVLFVFFKPHGIDSHTAFNLLDTWRDRLEAGIEHYFDAPSYSLVAALVLALAVGLWRGWIALDRRMWLALAALLLAAIVMPEEAMGGWGVDLRLPPILGAMAFASVQFKLGARAATGVAAIVLVIIAWNAAALAGNWRYYDRRFAEFRAADAMIPEGAKVVTVLDGDAIGDASDQPYWHMAEFAVIDRAAFTPLLFTTKGQHVVRLQPGLDRIAAQSARQGSPPDISELDDLSNGQVDGDTDIEYVFPYLMRFQCHFDEVVLVHLNGKRSPVPGMLRLRHAGSFFALYDVDRTTCPGR